MAKMAGISANLGIVALLISSAQIMNDDKLTSAQKIAQITLNVVIWMATNALVRLLPFFAPALAAVLGAIIAGILAYIGYILAKEYLSLMFNIRNRKFYYV